MGLKIKENVYFQILIFYLFYNLLEIKILN